MDPAAFGDEVTISILMPVRNEALTVPLMAKILRAVMDAPYEIVVVYDDPSDTTIGAVHQMEKHDDIRLIHNTSGRGVAKAIQAGVRAARGRYVLIFAADEIGPVLSIAEMLALMERGCDLVSCTRYARGGRRLGGSRVGGMLSRAANFAFRQLTGFPLSDATTGVKMCRRELLLKIPLESQVGWACTFELAYKAHASGARLGEVPIISIDRLYGGQSTFKLGPWVVEYLRWFLRAMSDLETRRRGPRSPLIHATSHSTPNQPAS